MNGDAILVYFMKAFVFITTPVTFIVGIFLIYDFNTYLRIEKFLSKRYYVSKKNWVGWLGKNRESLQMFLLSKRRIFGLICLLNAIIVFVMNFSLIKKGINLFRIL